MVAIVALAASALVVSSADTVEETPASPSCLCPEMTSGWILFDDSSRRVPDFWWEDSLEVQEISLCRHGLTFVFLARERGNQHLVSLLMADPDAGSGRLAGKVAERGGPDRFREKYSRLVREATRLSGGRLAPGSRIDFRRGAPEDRPVLLSPAARLALRWRGTEILLRGYLDVYLGMMS